MKKISRRSFLAAAGVSAAALALTACGGSSSTAASASTAAGSAAGSAASGDTIKVGVLGPMTGDVSVYGLAVINGATLYLEQVNANGGVNGKQLEVITMDEQGDATQAVTCFTKMCDQGITALVGDVTTTPTLALAAESADYNMPMVTASATAEAVTYDAETDTVNENVFRATFTDPFQGIKMADYAYQKLGYTQAAVIYLKGADYNEGLAENFVKEFESLGGTIVDQETYAEGDVDFKTQLTTILGKNPQVVFCPNYYQDVGQILAQAESIGLTVPFLGGDGWDGLEGYATADQLKDAYFCANYAKGSNTEFESAYKEKYGEDYPNGFAPLGYDAAMTVVYGLQAAEDAGLEAGTDEYKQAVIDAIASGTIDGITGTFTFDEHHNPVKQTAILCFDGATPVLKEMF
ncbi:MAG: ABC transporter substrate-binding protein [Ruminococcaceae bacterium]|nr:ABC transporter substrate-binding protein [Oscillospiraceae bacterium]